MLIQIGWEGARPNNLVFTSYFSSRNEELNKKGVLICWIGTYTKEIETIEKENADNINETKIILANEATAMLHGLDEAKKSQETAKDIFTNNNLNADLPTIKLKSEELYNEVLLSDLILRMDFASSKSASRKLIRGNAVKIDKELIKVLYLKTQIEDNSAYSILYHQ